MGSVVIPRSYMGQTIDEALIRSALIEMNGDFHFDLGAAHGIWHPQIDNRQGVFHKGAHICSMDRGMVPEVPIWTMKRERVRVPAHEVGVHDDFPSFEVQWADGKPQQTGFAFVTRPERDQIIFVGWRHTFRQIIRARVPGVTQQKIELKFGIDLGPKPGIQDEEIPEEERPQLTLGYARV